MFNKYCDVKLIYDKNSKQELPVYFSESTTQWKLQISLKATTIYQEIMVNVTDFDKTVICIQLLPNLLKPNLNVRS